MMMVSSTQTQLISEEAGEVMTIISHSYSCVCSIFHVVCTSRAGGGGCGRFFFLLQVTRLGLSISYRNVW